MIGSVRGTVIERTAAGEVLVEVGGVGYRAFVPAGALPALHPGDAAFLFTHLHVREDAMVLYGFPTRDERDTFEALIATTGVGPKLALAMLSVHSPAGLRRALLEDDLAALTMVPGVGKRTAQRLLVELKTRLEVPELDLAEPGNAPGAAGRGARRAGGARVRARRGARRRRPAARGGLGGGAPARGAEAAGGDPCVAERSGASLAEGVDARSGVTHWEGTQP